MRPHNHQADFDHAFWHDHWQRRSEQDHRVKAHPYLAEEIGHLAPGTALDAGCGTGAEALWLAEHGWQVIGVDISETALDLARQHPDPAVSSIEWICADLTTWEPNRQWDLVLTSYAHTPLPQLEFYTHIARWVAPGGALLVVAHMAHQDAAVQHPAEATVTPEAIAQLFAGPQWQLETARSHTRQMQPDHDGPILHDVIVRVRRNH